MKRREFLLKLGGITLVLPFGWKLTGCGDGDYDTTDDDDTIDDDDTTDDDDSGNDDDDSGNDDDDATDDDDTTSADDDDSVPPCTLAPATGTANSHGHTITIPLSDLQNPPSGGGSYLSTGGHSHSVTLSQQELVDLATNCTLTTTNSAGHAHTWTITIP